MTPLSQRKSIFAYELAPWLSGVIDTAESKLRGVTYTAESKLSSVIDTARHRKGTAESIFEFLKALIFFKETVK